MPQFPFFFLLYCYYVCVLILLILSSMSSTLSPMLSNALFIQFIEFFHGKVPVQLIFRVSYSLVKYSFFVLILVMSSLNYLPDISCSSLSFIMTNSLNSQSVIFQNSVTLNLVSRDIFFSRYNVIRFFKVLDKLFHCWHIQCSRHLST